MLQSATSTHAALHASICTELYTLWSSPFQQGGEFSNPSALGAFALPALFPFGEKPVRLLISRTNTCLRTTTRQLFRRHMAVRRRHGLHIKTICVVAVCAILSNMLQSAPPTQVALHASTRTELYTRMAHQQLRAVHAMIVIIPARRWAFQLECVWRACLACAASV